MTPRADVTRAEILSLADRPFVQRFAFCKYVLGERTNDALLLARWFESTGPMTEAEFDVVSDGWRKEQT